MFSMHGQPSCSRSQGRRPCSFAPRPEDFEFLQSFLNPIITGATEAFNNSRGNRSDRASGSTVVSNNNGFEATLDVQHFAAEEIKVRVTGENTILVEAKHEEKEDEHGFVARQFSRRYILPEGCDISKVQTKLSSDGILTIVAPKKVVETTGEINIPITVEKTDKPVN